MCKCCDIHSLAQQQPCVNGWCGMDFDLALVTTVTYWDCFVDIYWLRHRLFEHILTGLLTYSSCYRTYIIQRGPGFRKSDNWGCRESRVDRNFKYRMPVLLKEEKSMARYPAK